MHTYVLSDGRIFLTDGSFTGNVRIRVPHENVDMDFVPGGGAYVTVTLAWDDVVAMVAEKIRDSRLGMLEQMTPAQLLGLDES
jgi:hypothetical protein